MYRYTIAMPPRRSRECGWKANAVLLSVLSGASRVPCAAFWTLRRGSFIFSHALAKSRAKDSRFSSRWYLRPLSTSCRT